ncbi:MAG: NADH-quinone oxidoreductase subunit J [Nitrososphaeria archaeon]|nr:NADH-quinone oxidoreductase subunit J [Nitrososphaeria archaeon]
MEAFYQILFGLLAFIAALSAIESRDIIRALLYFLLFNVIVGIIMYALGAPYAGLFQILVYAGGVTVLFLAALHTMGGRIRK